MLVPFDVAVSNMYIESEIFEIGDILEGDGLDGVIMCN